MEIDGKEFHLAGEQSGEGACAIPAQDLYSNSSKSVLSLEANSIQRGIVGADLASIMAKRTAKPEVRAAARQAAITKAKTEKKDKEAKKSSAKASGVAAPKVSKQSMKGGAGKGGR